jgi:hypothetical protein
MRRSTHGAGRPARGGRFCFRVSYSAVPNYLRNIPESWLAELLPPQVRDLDVRHLLEGVLAGAQDRLQDLRAYIGSFPELVNPQAGQLTVVVATYVNEAGMTVSVPLNVNTTTPSDASELVAWAASEMNLEESQIISAVLGTDSLRQVDVGTLSLLAASLGAALYPGFVGEDSETVAARQRQTVETYFPRLRVKGTPRSFTALAKLSGFDDGVLVPLWSRLSPRDAANPASPDNLDDFRAEADYLPTSTLPDEIYDPSDLNDGPFYGWTSRPLSEDAASSNYYLSAVNGDGPFIALKTLSAGTINHPSAGTYALSGGAPGIKAFASFAGTSNLVAEALAPGSSTNGLSVVVTADSGTTRVLSVLGQLSSLKFRSSYFDAKVWVEDAGTQGAAPSPDLAANPSLTADGIAVAPWRPWSGGRAQSASVTLWPERSVSYSGGVTARAQAAGTTPQVNTAALVSAGARVFDSLAEAQVASRRPRLQAVGLLNRDDVNLAAYPASSILTNYGSVGLRSGTIYQSDRPLSPYTGDFYTATSTGTTGLSVEVDESGSILSFAGPSVSGTYNLQTSSYRATVAVGFAGTVFSRWRPLDESVIRPEPVGVAAYQRLPEGTISTDDWALTHDDFNPWISGRLMAGGDDVNVNIFEPFGGDPDAFVSPHETYVHDLSGTPRRLRVLDVYEEPSPPRVKIFAADRVPPLSATIATAGTSAGSDNALYPVLALDRQLLGHAIWNPARQADIISWWPLTEHSTDHLTVRDIIRKEDVAMSGVLPSDRVWEATSLIIGDDSTFASNTGFWSTESAVIGGGVCTFDPSGSSIWHSGLLTTGKRYRVELDRVGVGRCYLVNDFEQIAPDMVATGHYTFDIGPTANQGFGVVAVGGTVDNVTVFEIDAQGSIKVRGWDLRLASGGTIESRIRGQATRDYSYGFWIKPLPGTLSSRSNVFHYGPSSVALLQSGATVSASLAIAGSSGEVYRSSELGLSTDYNFVGVAVSGGTASLSVYPSSASISGYFAAAGSADTYGFTGARRDVRVSDLAVWKAPKTAAEFNLIRAPRIAPALFGTAPCVMSVHDDRYTLQLLDSGFVVPRNADRGYSPGDLPGSVQRYSGDGRFDGDSEFKVVGLGDAQIMPPVLRLGTRGPNICATGKAVLAGTRPAIPGTSTAWAGSIFGTIYPGVIPPYTTSGGMATVYNSISNSGTNGSWPGLQQNYNGAVDRIFVESGGSVYRVIVDDLGTGPTLSASLVQRDYDAASAAIAGRVAKDRPTDAITSVSSEQYGALAVVDGQVVQASPTTQGFVFAGRPVAGTLSGISQLGMKGFSVAWKSTMVSAPLTRSYVFKADAGGFSLYVQGGVFRISDGITSAISFLEGPAIGVEESWVYTRNETGNLLYRNGIVTSAAYGFGIKNFEYDTTELGYEYDGPISDVKVYNRVLSAEDVSALYTSGAPASADYNNADNVSGIVPVSAQTPTASFFSYWNKAVGDESVSLGLANLPGNGRGIFNENLTVGHTYRVNIRVDTLPGGETIRVFLGSGNEVTPIAATGDYEREGTAAGDGVFTIYHSGVGTAKLAIVRIFAQGLLVELDPHQRGIGSVWMDISGNDNNATRPLSGGVEWLNLWQGVESTHLFMYLTSKLKGKAVNAFDYWTNRTSYGEALAISALEAPGSLVFENSGVIPAGNYRLSIDAGNLGVVDLGFKGFSVELTVVAESNDPISVDAVLVKGGEGDSPRDTTAIEFKIPHNISGSWIMTVNWLSDYGQDTALSMAVYGYELRQIVQELYEVQADPLALNLVNTSYAEPALQAGAWVAHYSSRGTVATMTHESRAYSASASTGELAASPIADTLTGSSYGRIEDLQVTNPYIAADSPSPGVLVPAVLSLSPISPYLNVGGTVTASVSSSGGVSPLRYVWYFWNSGTVCTAGSQATRFIDRGGTLAVSALVVDAIGQSSAASGVVVVNNPPNVDLVTASTNNMPAPYLTTLTAVSSDADIADPVTTAWYSDGTVFATGATVAGYQVTAPHTVRVVVQDNRGGTNYADLFLGTTVDQPPTVSISALPVKPKANYAQDLRFSAIAFDQEGRGLSANWRFWDSTTSPGAAATMSYFGGGTYCTVQKPVVADSTAVVGNSNVGMKLVAVDVTDSRGQVATAGATIEFVTNSRPIIGLVTVSAPGVAQGEAVYYAATAYDPDGDVIHYEWFFPTLDPKPYFMYGPNVCLDTSTIAVGSTVSASLRVYDDFGGEATVECPQLYIAENGLSPIAISPAGGYSSLGLVADIVSPDAAQRQLEVVIRYTLDGTDPQTIKDGTEYRGPVMLPFQQATTVTLRARAFKEGYAPSALAKATYFFYNSAGG